MNQTSLTVSHNAGTLYITILLHWISLQQTMVSIFPDVKAVSSQSSMKHQCVGDKKIECIKKMNESESDCWMNEWIDEWRKESMIQSVHVQYANG